MHFTTALQSGVLLLVITRYGLTAEDVWPMPAWPKADPASVAMDPAALEKARDYALTGGGAGYITRQRVGRRNHYVVDPLQTFRHPHEAGHQVGELLEVFRGTTATAARAAARHGGAASAASAAAAAAAVAVTEFTSGVPDLPI